MPVLTATISHDLWVTGVPVAEKVIRTIAVYAGLVLLLRVGGKRDLAQLNSFDLVVLLLLSNVVQNAVIGGDNSLLGGLLGAAVLVTVNSVVVRLVRRNDIAVRLFEGSASVLIEDGVLDERSLRDLGIRPADVASAIRRQGADSIAEVKEATLEPGGAIVVKLQPKEEAADKGDIDRLERKIDEITARLGS